MWGGGRDGGWAMPYGLRIAAHSPRINPEPLIRAEHPWEGWISGGTTQFEDEGRIRLYYPAYTGSVDQRDPEERRRASEESDCVVPW